MHIHQTLKLHSHSCSYVFWHVHCHLSLQACLFDFVLQGWTAAAACLYAGGVPGLDIMVTWEMMQTTPLCVPHALMQVGHVTMTGAQGLDSRLPAEWQQNDVLGVLCLNSMAVLELHQTITFPISHALLGRGLDIACALMQMGRCAWTSSRTPGRLATMCAPS